MRNFSFEYELITIAKILFKVFLGSFCKTIPIFWGGYEIWENLEKIIEIEIACWTINHIATNDDLQDLLFMDDLVKMFL